MKISCYYLIILFAGCTFSLFGQQVPVIKSVIQTSDYEWTDLEIKQWERVVEKYDLAYFYDNFNEVTQKEFTPALLKKIKLFDTVEYWIEHGYFPWQIWPIGCSWYCGANYYTEASSELLSQGNNTYSVKNLADDDTRTAWVEGVPGYGIGEYILFRFPPGAARATSCTLINGYAKNETTWRNNSRVKTFNMYVDDELLAIIELQDTRKQQTFSFPHPVGRREDEKECVLKFMITDVYKGEKYDDTAISELLFDGIDVHCLAAGTMITMENGTHKPIEQVRAGDRVRSYEPVSGIIRSSVVSHLHNARHEVLIHVVLENGLSLQITPQHPVFTTEGKSAYKQGQSGFYNKDTSLMYFENGQAGWSRIVEKEEMNCGVPAYTLELDTEDAFIANGIVVFQE